MIMIGDELVIEYIDLKKLNEDINAMSRIIADGGSYEIMEKTVQIYGQLVWIRDCVERKASPSLRGEGGE